MTLDALVVETGRQRIGTDLREATLAVYHDGKETFRFEMDLDNPKIGDRWKVALEKKT